jgi:D-galactose 1-dehydrogenase
VRLVRSRLEFPRNRATPIGAELILETKSGVPVTAVFDWRQTGPQTWKIAFLAENDRFDFVQGQAATALSDEYGALYLKFRELARDGRSDVDLAPLQLVADAFLTGRIDIVQPFDE